MDEDDEDDEDEDNYGDMPELKGKWSNPFIGKWSKRAKRPKLVVEAPPPPFSHAAQAPLHDFRPITQVVISYGTKALANKK